MITVVGIIFSTLTFLYGVICVWGYGWYGYDYDYPSFGVAFGFILAVSSMALIVFLVRKKKGVAIGWRPWAVMGFGVVTAIPLNIFVGLFLLGNNYVSEYIYRIIDIIVLFSMPIISAGQIWACKRCRRQFEHNKPNAQSAATATKKCDTEGCGKEYPPDVYFCDVCGRRLVDAPPLPPPLLPPPEEDTGRHSASAKNKAPTGVFVALIAALVAVIVYLLVSKSGGGDAGREETPTGGDNTFTDSRDGKTYRMVKIGNQTWMAENLNYQTGNSWCYGDNSANCDKYGRLYDWNTAMNACPEGWRLPSDAEWDSLVSAAGGKEVAGKKLMSKTDWNNQKDGSSGNGTDNFGFSALPGGYGYGSSFVNDGNYGYWWGATEYGASNAWYRVMHYHREDVSRSNRVKEHLFSVRCLRE